MPRRNVTLSLDTTDGGSEETDPLISQYQEWDLEHAKMKEHPPKDARNYIRHARNILPLLESLAELHPVAKVVVFTFRAVINFQYDRVENDLRVNSVFLTKVDMMRAVLEIHFVAQRRKDPSVIDSNERLLDRLRKIAEDIKECGNAIDTYNKESRLVRFVKSQEWKGRMMEFNDTFIGHRIALMQLLSIRMAQGVDDLHVKMDVLLTHAFNANQEWEKKIQKRLRQYGSLDSWITDMSKVQRLLDLTEDPYIDPDLFGHPDSSQDSEEIRRHRLNSFMTALRSDLESTVKTQCENNLETFTKKLEFHTQQLQEAISRAATYVVDQLSGPHGRLYHEDLKKLWKEMDWIFCVDIKIFSMALHEYYLDRFSAKLLGVPGEEASSTQKRDEDQWTLEYLGPYSQEICEAIDRDLSGYIRISEVNAFTNEIPEGWTFPQWCVYQGIGWHYEQQIYQKRLQYLLDSFYELLPHVTPWNRGNVQETGRYLGLLHNLSRGPIIKPYNFLPPRFLELIRQKVAKQDEKYRNGFKKLEYHIDSDDTVRMLFEHNTVESYILQLGVLIMEHCVHVASICKQHTVDLRDWDDIADNLETVRTVVTQRIRILEGDRFLIFISHRLSEYAIPSCTVTFKDKGLNFEKAMETFKGGLYRVCYYENVFAFNEVPKNIKWGEVEVHCRLEDFDILNNVGFPSIYQNDPGDVLKYPTWEAYNPDADPEEVPPPVWTDDQEEIEYYNSCDIEPREPSFWPHHLRRCNNCSRFPITDMACYHCIDCKDYDLCGECFRLPFDSLNTKETACDGRHLENHDLIKMMLSFPQPYHRWIRALAAFRREEEVQYGVFSQPESNNDGGNQPAQVVCTQCKEPIVSGAFYRCLHNLCRDVYLCQECEEHHDFSGDPHTEGDYFAITDTPLVGYTPLASSYAYQDEHEDEEGEEEGEAHDGEGEGDEGDGEGQQNEVDPPESVVDSEEAGPTTASHRSWHTLLLFQDQVAEEDSEFNPSGQGAPGPIHHAEDSGNLGPHEDDRVARLEARMDGLESHMNELKEMLAELLAR